MENTPERLSYGSNVLELVEGSEPSFVSMCSKTYAFSESYLSQVRNLEQGQDLPGLVDAYRVIDSSSAERLTIGELQSGLAERLYSTINSFRTMD